MKEGVKLYRGTAQTKKELQALRDKIGVTDYYDCMAMTGFISTSMDRAQAEGFVWANPQLHKEQTLFEIHWKSYVNYYSMDMSDFPDEKEIILYDGLRFEVKSIDETVGKNRQTLHVVVLEGPYFC